MPRPIWFGQIVFAAAAASVSLSSSSMALSCRMRFELLLRCDSAWSSLLLRACANSPFRLTGCHWDIVVMHGIVISALRQCLRCKWHPHVLNDR